MKKSIHINIEIELLVFIIVSIISLTAVIWYTGYQTKLNSDRLLDANRMTLNQMLTFNSTSYVDSISNSNSKIAIAEASEPGNYTDTYEQTSDEIASIDSYASTRSVVQGNIALASTPAHTEVTVKASTDEIITTEIELLKAGDSQMVIKYFGKSDVYTPDKIANQVKTTVITFIGEETVNDKGNKVRNIHVCNVDYIDMNKDYEGLTAQGISDEDAKIQLAKNTIDRKYDTCYNIPVELDDNGVIVSEALKEALTGRFYTTSGTNMVKVDCIVK